MRSAAARGKSVRYDEDGRFSKSCREAGSVRAGSCGYGPKSGGNLEEVRRNTMFDKLEDILIRFDEVLNELGSRGLRTTRGIFSG